MFTRLWPTTVAEPQVGSPGPSLSQAPLARPSGVSHSSLGVSRRGFLGGLLAMSMAPTFVDAAIDGAEVLEEGPDEVVDAVWDQLLDDPVELFVNPGGALGFGSAPEPEPTTRLEAFDFDETMLDTPEDLAWAASDLPPLGEEIRRVLDRWREDAQGSPEATQRGTTVEPKGTTPDLSPALRRALLELPHDLSDIEDHEDMEALLESLPRPLFAQLRKHLRAWLLEEPDGPEEHEHFAMWFRPQEGALRHVRDMGLSREVMNDIGLRVVEGEHPGSSYYAAELKRPADEANARAQELGVPLRFVALE